MFNRRMSEEKPRRSKGILSNNSLTHGRFLGYHTVVRQDGKRRDIQMSSSTA
jgi:hypothetical protein